MTHTPTPWIDITGRLGHFEITANNYQSICIGRAVFGTPEENIENAKFIVKAVNNHDKLISALEGMLEWARRVKGKNEGNEVFNALNALKQVESEG